MNAIARAFRDWRLRLLLTALVAFGAAFAGVRMADHWRAASEDERLLDRIKPVLRLSPQQAARIGAREALFERRRVRLEAQIRAQDAHLAAAIDREHMMGPEVRAATRAAQETIWRLQDEQIATLLAAREVLTPEQATVFDQSVRRALTQQ